MNTSFLSTSKDEQMAKFFSDEKQQRYAILCAFVVNNNQNRGTALYIEYLSNFPHEREVLVLPFVRRIMSWNRKRRRKK